jgi:hypothetical protein
LYSFICSSLERLSASVDAASGLPARGAVPEGRPQVLRTAVGYNSFSLECKSKGQRLAESPPSWLVQNFFVIEKSRHEGNIFFEN